ncbi:MAG: PqqD family protein [Candidatus Aminicenantes bacterium]|nr:PqqD family protein [Candidatus Aminicenantes bacterium]
MEKENKEANLLELIPVRNIKWTADGQGKVILLKPKFKNKFCVKHILPRMKRPFYKVKLDEMGSFFWKNCDGEKNVREIARLHREKFGDDAEPVLDRICLFLQGLDRNHFITFK